MRLMSRGNNVKRCEHAFFFIIECFFLPLFFMVFFTPGETVSDKRSVRGRTAPCFSPYILAPADPRDKEACSPFSPCTEFTIKYFCFVFLVIW